MKRKVLEALLRDVSRDSYIAFKIDLMDGVNCQHLSYDLYAYTMNDDGSPAFWEIRDSFNNELPNPEILNFCDSLNALYHGEINRLVYPAELDSKFTLSMKRIPTSAEPTFHVQLLEGGLGNAKNVVKINVTADEFNNFIATLDCGYFALMQEARKNHTKFFDVINDLATERAIVINENILETI
ncbi:MAG: hypothetical protein V1646_00245 [bacterium]